MCRVQLSADGENWFTADLEGEKTWGIKVDPDAPWVEEDAQKWGRHWAWVGWVYRFPKANLPASSKDGKEVTFKVRALDSAYSSQPPVGLGLKRGYLINSYDQVPVR